MNPYINRSMITDPAAFYGRNAVLRRIFDLLERPSSINIVGNRRIGKSSLLAHITREEVYRDMLREPEHYLFVFVDLQELAELNQERFFAIIMSRASEKSGGQIPAYEAEEADARTFRRFVRQHCQPAGPWKLICCFDEFEKMSNNPNFNVPFFQTLRALAQQYNLGYVISSRLGINELCHKGQIEGSQFWNIFALEPLRLMAPEEAGELITQPAHDEGVQLSPQEIMFVNTLAGAYPFFIQIACFHLFSIRETKDALSPVDFEAIRDRYTTEVGFHFEFMWEQLDGESRACLIDLARGKERSTESRAVRELLNQSLIAVSDNKAIPFSVAFQDYVLEQASELPAKEEPGEEDGLKPVVARTSAGPVLSICLWGDRSAVVELDAPRRIYTVCQTREEFDARKVEDWRRQAQQIYERQDRWRENLRRMGSILFTEIVLDNPKINGAFSAGLTQADDAGGKPLEIVFRTPRELLSLPLELQFEEDFASGEEGPLALLHPIARYITDAYFDRPALKLPLPEGRKLNVLLLAGADGGENVQPLALENELQPLFVKMQNNPLIDRVDLVYSREHSFQAVQDLIRGGIYDIIHFAGHGEYFEGDPEASGLLFFRDGAGGEVATLTTGALQDLMRRNSVRLFFVNACSTAAGGNIFQKLDRDFLGIMDALIVAKIPTIIGLRWPIYDHSAVTLSHTFYEELFKTGSPMLALWEARCALARNDRNDPAWASPILIMQEG